MGVTRQGKVAVLTNYREDSTSAAIGIYSRGAIVNNWLIGSTDKRDDTEEFVQSIVANPEVRQVGGFSLVCGRINEPLAIVSNRSTDMDQITWVATEKNQTRGLSNTSFDDRSWPKIINGEKEATIETYIQHLHKTIFVPRIGTPNDPDQDAEDIAAAQVQDEIYTPANGAPNQSFTCGSYGTQKQTVLLARPDGRVRYFERTLYDNDAKPVPIGQGDYSFEFNITE